MTVRSRQTVLDLVQWSGEVSDLIAAARRIPQRVTPEVILERATGVNGLDLQSGRGGCAHV